ncbi:MAG: SH3 domain-containing protein [Candidatus Omnitrophica bacterium]|nr:SH3 domain-containing protein [Candidatus Omnitrophota bacterium]
MGHSFVTVMFVKIVLAVLVAVISLSESGFAETRFPFVGETTDARVKIRAGENNNFEVLTTLDKGVKVIVIGKSFQWYKVRLPESARAYIRSSYLAPINPQVAEVKGDRVNVRAMANTNATILGQLKRGDKVVIKEAQGDWTLIKPVDSLSGWIHEKLVTFKAQDVPPQATLDATVLAQKVLDAKAKKIALLKKLDSGQVECSGFLTKGDGEPLVYKIIRDKATVCIIDGPASLLETFVNGQIIVQGTLKDVLESDEAARVALSKIRRTF